MTTFNGVLPQLILFLSRWKRDLRHQTYFVGRRSVGTLLQGFVVTQ